MRKTGSFLALLAVLALAGCGGSDPADDAFQPGTPPTNTPDAPTVASLTATTSTPTIPSDGSVPAEIRVYARNANNQLVSGVPITFSSDSGALNVVQAATDTGGVASATLIPLDDPAQRTITVTASAGAVSTTVSVLVTGSSLSVQGPPSMTLGQTATFTVTLLDAGNDALANKAVTIASARNNALSATSVTTDPQGRATFTLTANTGPTDTITATALGLTATQTVTINSDQFAFVAPAPSTEVKLNDVQQITLRWHIAGVPQVNKEVTFSTTRGSVTPSGITDGNGEVSVDISATNAGGAVITATAESNIANLPVEFVATTPATIDVQPSMFSLGIGQSSTITAVVRDADGNLVKNQTVVFTLDDVTGGTLSTGAAVTDSQGRAQTVYTASSTTSANEGVKVTARVQGATPTLQDEVFLTVARRELFLSLGTGNTITEPNEATYAIVFAVTVTDANGAGVANVPLSARILSTRYYKGTRAAAPPPATGWTTSHTASCADEDLNRNGQLDESEDNNMSGRIEAGNIASVSIPGVTNASGQALITVTYPQEYAYYLDVELSVSSTVQGTEYVRSSNFRLPGSSEDFNSTTIAPPGMVSPFGQSNTCNDVD